MKINEIFCSLSGESLYSGYRAIFIRTYGCQLSCSYCDSVYACKGGDYSEMSIDEIMKDIAQYDCKHVVFTGGEPLLQEDAIDLIKVLIDNGYRVEIETNGACDIKPVKDLYSDKVIVTMDWKCPSSAMTSKMNVSNLSKLTYSDVVKCVVGTKEDLDQAKCVRQMTDAQVYVSPVFGQIELVDIANYLLDNKINDIRLQVQLHKLVWSPDMRGV